MYDREFVVGISPLEVPEAGLVLALYKAGAKGVLDLGHDRERALNAIGQLTTQHDLRFGVRISRETADISLPPQVDLIVTPFPMEVNHWKVQGRKVFSQVCSVEEARAAEANGVDGLIAKGNESGGRVGEDPCYILLQAIIPVVKISVWAQGGIGLHTVAAAIASGAKGIVLDSQLALFSECLLSEQVKRAIAAMDGSETVVVAGHRVFTRPGLSLPTADSSPEEIEKRFGTNNLKEDLIAVGQDGAFAKDLAERFRSISGLVRSIERTAAAQIRQAKILRPLGPRSAWARSHGVTYPIVQGPMSSVSDKPAFAKAVADGGGVPCIALSLMSGEQAGLLLKETSELLEGRPWGVGLIGFAPSDLYQEQVSLLLEIRPPLAIIAGGKPSQAIDLEKQGIETYLHVPSPGLLDLFLKEGARKFVFEGRECGGHVGPRSSFVLWESAIRALLKSEHLSEVTALFAGGIHDQSSAAMVSALAAPLVAGGAKIGVLMGTAYLFTEEAVRTGAILPGFQEVALDCKQTVLLETAPGHAVRAAPSEYVAHFLRERARLEAAKTDSREIWTVLESMNLGRLRIAAKAENMADGSARPVDYATQRQQGLFMLGQIAALRQERTTIAALHEQVSQGSVNYLAQLAAPLISGPEVKPIDIAVVGMACVMPEAEDLAQYWTNILEGKSCIKEVPATRWNHGQYFDSDGIGDKTPSKWGGFVPDIVFEPAEFGIPPRSLSAIDPAQLLSLLVAKRALKDAGIDGPELDRQRISVFFGAEGGSELEATYGFRMMYPQLLGTRPPELDAHLPELTEDSFAGTLANVIPGRIANRLDLGGLNFSVNAACASSLAALDVGCKDLVLGGADVVIVGGADLHNSICDYLLFASVRALSSSGKVRPFDAKADGIILGEGVSAVVLKRLEDAERDQDRIYAVIKGVGGSSDGRSLGLTAPNKQGQAKALQRAYEQAGICPAEVELVEAHGTGTVVGDRTELASLTEFMTSAGAAPGGCALGTVKSQVGHTKCNAGIAGLIKATLSVYQGVLPPTSGIESPNPYYDANHSPFSFYREPRPWLSERRRAGVSALGFGGTNFHAVIESVNDARTPQPSIGMWPAELFLFRGSNRAQAEGRVAKLAKLVNGKVAYRLCDLAASIAASGDAMEPVQIAIIAESVGGLSDRLARVTQAKESSDGIFVAQQPDPSGKVAFLFPGQGSQRPGMLAELFIAFPRLRPWLAQGKRFAHVLYPSSAFTAEQRVAQKEALSQTTVAQPALAIADMALADLLDAMGIRADMTAGHSFGELAALAYARSISPDKLVALATARAESMLKSAGAEPGGMAAILASPSDVEKHLEGFSGVVIANRNAPQQTVISGAKQTVIAAMEKFRSAGISCQLIPVSCAFHSPVMAKGAELFATFLERTDFQTPRLEVYSNVTAQRYSDDPEVIQMTLARQIVSPVRFEEQILAMYEAGARVFVEVGPSDVLTGLVSRILRGQPHRTIVTDQPALGSIRSLLEALARLAVLGTPIQTAPLFEGRAVNAFNLDSPPGKPPSASAWVVDGQRARPLNAAMPVAGLRPILEPLQLTAPALAPATTEKVGTPEPIAPDSTAPVAGDSTVSEYFQSMREINQTIGKLIDGQLQVITGYLGASPKAREVAQHTRSSLTAVQDKKVISHPPAVVAVPVASAPAPVPIPPAAAVDTAPTAAALAGHSMEVLVSILSERTGYPPEMLDPDLDLEADLGIDSIKRTELLGALRQRLNLSGDGISAKSVEELATVKTLKGISQWLEAHLPAFGAAPTATPAPTPAPALSAPQPPAANKPKLEPIRILTEIVAERTGYPIEMLDADLDLEADLGIDSIKRAEILLSLNQRLNLSKSVTDGMRAELTDALGRLKTLRSIGEWIATRIPDARNETAVAPSSGGNGSSGNNGQSYKPTALLQTASSNRAPHDTGDKSDAAVNLRLATKSPAKPVTEKPSHAPVVHQIPATITGRALESVAASTPTIQRTVLEVVEAGPPKCDKSRIKGRIFGVTEDSQGVARALIELLEFNGARGLLIRTGDRLPRVDGLVHLDALHAKIAQPVKSLFELAQQALEQKAGWIVGATILGGRLCIGDSAGAEIRGAGVAGFLKSLSFEAPLARVRAVDLNRDEPAEKLAQQLFTELVAEDSLVEVGYAAGVRYKLSTVERPLQKGASVLPLGPESVVLITGGARGIASRVAIALARKFKCSLELIGRSPAPQGEEAALTASCPDAASIRKTLARQTEPKLTLPEIQTRCNEILNTRQIRATLEAIRAAGSKVTYHPADVRNRFHVGQIVAKVYETRGRIDGVIHAAGITEDHLLADKRGASFDRVFDTKVIGARALIGALRSDTRFIVFFSSVASVWGNRGQTDYAAANDFLDKLALRLAALGSPRAFSINWGPWSEVGMVSRELERVYQNQGIALIPPDQGVERFFDELIYGNEPQVVIAAASPDTLKRMRVEQPAPVAQVSTAKQSSVLAALLSTANKGNVQVDQEKTVIEREISLKTFPELIDHSFYRQKSDWTDPADLGPVVPMSGLVELMMDAAQRLAPERKIIGVEEIMATRWLATAQPVKARIACRFESSDRVKAEIEGYASALVLFGDVYPPAPDEDLKPLKNQRKPPLSAEALYRDRWLFHGPAYQGIVTLGPMGDDGMRGELNTGSALGALLDNTGQIMGVWVVFNTEVDRRNMPVKIDRIAFYGPYPSAGTRMRCTGRVRELNPRYLAADMSLANDGKVWAVVEGWYSQRFSTDARIWDVQLWPEKNLLSTPHEKGFVVFHDQYRLATDRDFLAGRYLREHERQQSVQQGPRRKRAWVSGRVAAKDAIRQYLWSKGHGPIFPAEIWIKDDANGAPVICEPAGPNLKVSIAHKENIAVAIAAEGKPVGIDVETVEPREPGFEKIAFSPEELKLLDTGDRHLWLTRMWAAKEAFAKARGTGLEGNPRGIRIQERHGERFLIEGSWIDTIQFGDHVVAWTEV